MTMTNESLQNGSPTDPAVSASHLQRKLSEPQLSMIAIGGAIGVGLFLGSSVTVSLAGPSVILTYIFGALLALIMAYSLAEMAVVHPVAGSFGIYAQRYLNPWAGFTVRATYGLVQIIAIGAEVTAVAIYFQFWFPSIPQCVWVSVVSLGVVCINALHVGNFGEFEYWFSWVKVAAIIVFSGVGVVLITGLSPHPAVGLTNLIAFGGFFPHGLRGMWLAFTLTMSSYMGVEVLAVTAGEAKRPEEAIPRAMRTMVFRLILFYVLAIAVMVTVTPWNQTGDGTLSASPFVRAFASREVSRGTGQDIPAWTQAVAGLMAAIREAQEAIVRAQDAGSVSEADGAAMRQVGERVAAEQSRLRWAP